MHLKVFIAYARDFWCRKHSQVRRHVIEAVLHQHKDVIGLVSGPGWNHYDITATLQQNIDRLLPDAEVCWIYKAEGNPRLGIPPLRDAASVDCLKVMRIHEFWWDREKRIRECLDGRLDLAFCTHENDLPRFQEIGVPAVHIPQTADPAVFEGHTPIDQRPFDCVITGSISESHYPFRCRLRNLIRSGALSGVELPHPGYWLADEKANRRQLNVYARHLQQAKIVLTCSSRHKYALGRPVEAMMAGAVVACDLPDDSLFQQTLGKHMLILNPAVSDSELASYLKAWLRRPDELQKLATAGQNAALASYTNTHWAERMIAECRKRIKSVSTSQAPTPEATPR